MSMVGRRGWNCCVRELQEVMESMEPDSPEKCTAKGQEATLASCNKANASCLSGQRSDGGHGAEQEGVPERQ